MSIFIKILKIRILKVISSGYIIIGSLIWVGSLIFSNNGYLQGQIFFKVFIEIPGIVTIIAISIVTALAPWVKE